MMFSTIKVQRDLKNIRYMSRANFLDSLNSLNSFIEFMNEFIHSFINFMNEFIHSFINFFAHRPVVVFLVVIAT